MALRNMQGTPAYIETLHSKDGQRRHKSNCEYYRSNDKWCTFLVLKCVGSAHCKFYKKQVKEEEIPVTVKPVIHKKPKRKNINSKVGLKVFHKGYGMGVIKEIRHTVSKNATDLVVVVQFENKSPLLSFRIPKAFNDSTLVIIR